MSGPSGLRWLNLGSVGSPIIHVSPPLEVLDSVQALLGADVNVEPVGEISPWSGTWLVRGKGETVFLKRTPRSRREALVVAAMSRIHPRLIPAVITTDVSPTTPERWFLLADAGECDRAALPVSVSVEVARTVGELQRLCANEAELSSLLPRCLAAELLDVALSCCRWALNGKWPPGEGEFLTAAKSDLIAASGAARHVGAALDRVAPSVVHGDLWAGNVARRRNRIVFVDWGDAFWGVGSIDIVNLVVGRPSALDAAATAEVWAAFAQGSGVDADEEFRRASQVAHTVASLLIDRAIAESIGRPPQWLRGVVPGFRGLLEQLREYGQ
ncbi:MAG: phosphotransferase family protein [Pseudonocardiaceae bacterium]